MARIEFRDVSKSYGSTKVIEHLNLIIEDGKFTVLVGPSGCGKTTLLRMIAGIGPVTSGQCLMDGKDITDVDPAKRGIAMVFQNYALYPTMTVRENIEFGLRNNKLPRSERDALIAEYTEIVGLSEYLNKKPSLLSGGQRQRVALARAMVKRPKVFLMDEPLSNLDAKLRVQMRVELIELQHRLKTTFVYVTHDQVEAMSMADQIVLMNGGVIQQQGTPEAIYDRPENVFTAQFIGTPHMNVYRLSNGYSVGFRPEIVRLKPAGLSASWQGTVTTREMLGSETIYKVVTGKRDIMVKSMDKGFAVGQTVDVIVSDLDLYFFNPAGKCMMEGEGYQECLKCMTEDSL